MFLAFLFSFFQITQPPNIDTSDIKVMLIDEVNKNNDSHFFEFGDTVMVNENNIRFHRFNVNHPLYRALGGFEYFEDRREYGAHTPIRVDIYDDDNIIICFDDNNDGIFDDRDSIMTSLEKVNSSFLIFKHASDKEKDLEIECSFKVSYSLIKGYQLYTIFNVKSSGTFELSNVKYELAFRKSLMTLDIFLNGQQIRNGNPVRIGNTFYKIIDYNPIVNSITFSKLNPNDKLYGTTKNLYIREDLFEEAMSFHNIDLDTINNKYHLFYFWGPWCHPCMVKMTEKAKMLSNLRKDIGIYHVSFIQDDSEEKINNVNDIVFNYDIPGKSLIESPGRKLDVKNPFIKLFDNRSYPNFVVLDANYKILFVEDLSKESFENFVSKLP